MSKQLGWVISLGISGLILFFLFRDFAWDSFAAELKHIKLLSIPVLIALTVLGAYIRSLRWRYLLPTNDIPIEPLFSATSIGFLATCILPFRAGEFARPLALSRFTAISFSAGFASIVVERVFDLLMVIGIATFSLQNALAEIPFAMLAIRSLQVVLAAVLVLIFFSGHCSAGIQRALDSRFISSLLPEAILKPLRHLLTEFFTGLRSVKSLKNLLLILLLSLCLWGSLISYFSSCLWAMGAPLDWRLGAAITALVALAIAAPSAPGFVGTFQLGCVAAFAAISTHTKEFAVAYSIISHAVQFICLILVGLLCLHLRGLALKNLVRA